MFRNKLGVALRDLVESASGAPEVRDVISSLLKDKKVTPEEFSLREIWEACERDEATGMVRQVSEAVSSDMFPVITGEIINARIISAYDAVAVVGDRLCTTVPSNMEVETVAGFDANENPEEVQQGKEYNDSDLGEKYVTIPHKKFGRILSVTEEMIYFDKTGQILARAQGIGKKAAQYREKLIVEGVQDVNSDVYRPSGAAAAFYRTAVSGVHRINSRASTPFGESGLDYALQLMHNMQDENSDYVLINTADLIGLFPYLLFTPARQMVGSTLVPESAENAVNVYKGAFTPLTSPYITAQSATTWYLGDFKEDFWWSEVWPLQTFAAAAGHEDEFRRDIKAKFKVRFYGQIGAVDSKHSFKFTA